ncbi:MaoC/PaaZ C-terminal domain-containing protein [Streptomyces sp. NPDC048560]|uniref:MaoC/PaaZ C-terminal domain-containing protein n=1 Tax=Streptomyces sp. NPDC048560 TaxID=3155488 RepID=UPI003429E374
MPSPIASLVRGAVTSPFKRPGRPGAGLPAARITLPPAPVAPGHLAAYSRICGFSESGALPLTYPHVLGFAPAMRLMTDRAFPLPVVGLVHTWIEITRHRVLRPQDVLELSVYADELTGHRRGTEVTVATEARIAGELVWESRSGYLSRHGTPRGTESAPPPAAPPPAPPPAVAEWPLAADLGRRYGAVSGDRNPIHLYPLTARLFGFPRPIAHGMWTVARCLAETGEPGRVRQVRADFRAPVPLPSTVTYAADSTDGPDSTRTGSAFELRDATGRVHLTGRTAQDAP